MLQKWQHIYETFDPIAFHLFGISVHWYGIMYVLALVSALMVGKWIVKHDKLPISDKNLGNYFFWVEIGVILGARLGYILFYDPHTAYYLLHPWQIFNPFMDGQFVGIRGMSYHGALIGFLAASYLFSRKYKEPFWAYMDLVAVAVPIGYVFGRIGNFLNQELIGRETTVPWGVYYHDILVHPSQLYEAFLEGIVVFAIMMTLRHYKKFDGMLALSYGFFYGLARFTAEFFRAPDIQIGYLCCNWLTMGQLLSMIMMLISIIGLAILYKRSKHAALVAVKSTKKAKKA